MAVPQVPPDRETPETARELLFVQSFKVAAVALLCASTQHHAVFVAIQRHSIHCVHAHGRECSIHVPGSCLDHANGSKATARLELVSHLLHLWSWAVGPNTRQCTRWHAHCRERGGERVASAALGSARRRHTHGNQREDSDWPTTSSYWTMAGDRGAAVDTANLAPWRCGCCRSRGHRFQRRVDHRRIRHPSAICNAETSKGRAAPLGCIPRSLWNKAPNQGRATSNGAIPGSL